MENNLQKMYEKVYENGKENFFTFETDDITEEVVKKNIFKNLNVVEIGCGTGKTSFAISKNGAKNVLAMDYSKNAILEAKTKFSNTNLEYKVGSFGDIKEKCDCFVLQEVIEHTDNPREILILLYKWLNNNGKIVITCPSFINVRGIVWMTLQILFDVPMTLSDKQFINPEDMIKWSKEIGFQLEWHTFRHSLSHGEMMVEDLKKRLTNALNDSKMKSDMVNELINWLKKVGNYQKSEQWNGSKAMYILKKL